MSINEENISIICPSPKGADTALKLTEILDASLYLKTKKNDCVSKYEDNKKIKIYSEQTLNRIIRWGSNLGLK